MQNDDIIALMERARFVLPDRSDLPRWLSAVRSSVAQYRVARAEPRPADVNREVLMAYRRGATLSAAAVRLLSLRARRLGIPNGEIHKHISTLTVDGGHTTGDGQDGTPLGRSRGRGKRSRSYVPHLVAYKVNRGRPSNENARNLLMHLQLDYHMATGELPPVTADHRAMGPFCRFVRELLISIGDPHVNVVMLFNELDRERKSRLSR